MNGFNIPRQFLRLLQPNVPQAKIFLWPDIERARLPQYLVDQVPEYLPDQLGTNGDLPACLALRDIALNAFAISEPDPDAFRREFLFQLWQESNHRVATGIDRLVQRLAFWYTYKVVPEATAPLLEPDYVRDMIESKLDGTYLRRAEVTCFCVRKAYLLVYGPYEAEEQTLDWAHNTALLTAERIVNLDPQIGVGFQALNTFNSRLDDMLTAAARAEATKRGLLP